MPKARLEYPPSVPKSVIVPLSQRKACLPRPVTSAYPTTCPALLMPEAELDVPPSVPKSVTVKLLETAALIDDVSFAPVGAKGASFPAHAASSATAAASHEMFRTMPSHPVAPSATRMGSERPRAKQAPDRSRSRPSCRYGP